MKCLFFMFITFYNIINSAYRKEAHKFFDKFLLYDKVSKFNNIPLYI